MSVTIWQQPCLVLWRAALCNVCCTVWQSVYSLLEYQGGLAMLQDPLMETATREILPDANKTRAGVCYSYKSGSATVTYFEV
jgi:hypothetical protein